MIPKELTTLRVESHAELVDGVRHILGSRIKRTIDTHNTGSTIFTYKDNGQHLVLKIEYEANTATHKEVGWYRLIKAQRGDWGTKFIDSHTTDTYALLLLEYIENSTTIDELVASKRYDSEIVCSFIQRSLAIDRALFDETANESTAQDVDKLYRDKYKQRRAEANAIPYLAELFSSSSILINGKRYVTPDSAMLKFETTPHILELLTPKKLGLTHGDLHCGNILIKGDELFLIDPNGNPRMPIEYDIGKILHSIHGNYDSIMRGEYSLDEQAPFSFDFSINMPTVYDKALSELKENISPDEYIRGLYSEALHFATMLPHHAAAKSETTALFLRSAQLFSELMEELGIS